MTNEEIAQARKDFELGLLFHFADMFPDEKPIGSLVMDDDGRYQNKQVQAAWRGYLMGHKHTRGMLERFHPDRFVSNAMTTELCVAMEMADSDQEWAEDIFNNVLKIAGAFPK